MNRARFSCVVLSAALFFAPSLFAFQTRSAVVHSLGVTSMTAHQHAAAINQAGVQGVPHEALRPMPKPNFNILGTRPALTAATTSAITFPVVGADSTERGFSGINTEDSNDGNGGGTAGIVSPPDQGLGGNETQLLEAVNVSLRVFSNSGKPLTDNIGMAEFFGVPPTNPDGSSNRLSDPRVFFDPVTRRFFMSILEFQTSSAGFVGSENLLAVSQSSNALGNYFLYSIEACPPTGQGTFLPCLADQPLIGVNQDGFYFQNNIFSQQGRGLAGELIALNIEALINNTTVTGVEYFLPDFSVQPALPAPGQITTQHNGTEYFITSEDNGPPSFGTTLRIYALVNTESLESGGVPTLLSSAPNDFPSEFYSNPVPANQKAGSYPLGQHFGDPEEFLNPDDDRPQQVYYAGGRLYTTLDTQLPSDTVERDGAAWFVIQPQATDTSVTAEIVHQGYIGIANGSVLYPAFSATNSGSGIIGFSFSGTNFFPSAGYVHYENGAIGTQVHTAALGQNAQDDFSGYPQFGGNGVARWGDYSAAFVSPFGHLWFAAEYIPNELLHPRTQFTDWGTFVSKVK
ncbi:MAG TPA: hypothetical protein VN517_06715 [Terriglobales bacterium]|nr:hypothetical protein [Terriglobales bacterium]